MYKERLCLFFLVCVFFVQFTLGRSASQLKAMNNAYTLARAFKPASNAFPGLCGAQLGA